MPFPVGLALGAVSLGRSLFGGRKKFKYREPAPFSYTPDENDAELGLRRRRALDDISRDRAYTQNELNRAGLFGSGASFGVMGQQQERGNRELEDITSDVFMKRRMEKYQDYRDRNAFERQRALMGDQAGYREDELGLEGLGDIGSYLGGELFGDEGGGEDYYNYAFKRRKKLPYNELLDAEYNSYQPPEFRR